MSVAAGRWTVFRTDLPMSICMMHNNSSKGAAKGAPKEAPKKSGCKTAKDSGLKAPKDRPENGFFDLLSSWG